MFAWFKSQDLEFVEQFLRLWKTDPLWLNFRNSVPGVFTPHGSTLLCWNVAIFFGREIAEIARYLPHKKFGFLSNCRYWANRAQCLPGPVPNIWLTIFQISSKSVDFRRSYRIAERVKAVLLAHSKSMIQSPEGVRANN